MTALIVLLIILLVPLAWLLLAKIVRRFANFPAPAYVSTFLDSIPDGYSGNLWTYTVRFRKPSSTLGKSQGNEP